MWSSADGVNWTQESFDALVPGTFSLIKQDVLARLRLRAVLARQKSGGRTAVAEEAFDVVFP